ncbi:MAG: phenylalanine--tRNA ligase subunit beta, partial [Clostridiaceae bacterium]|nr:phenylalanine--tRNA ligase subunit beta [Clostridiaceae bacterium]
RMEDIIRNTMTGCGLNEAYTLSIVSPKVFDQINLREDDPLRKTVVISNPMGEDFSILRTTTIPDMLKILSINNNRNIPEAKLFELSYVYIPIENKQLPDERQILTLGLYGNDTDFFELKGCIEELLANMGINKAEFKPETENPTFHPGRTAKLSD